MRRAVTVVALVLLTGLALAQETTYTPSENPFQSEFDFVLGRAVELRADVQGVRLDAVTVSALETVEAGKPIKCEVELLGNNLTDRKVTISAVLLLENETSKGMDRIQVGAFKVKAGKGFAQKQEVSVGGDALSQAVKVYVLVQIEF
jgi:hypothetical protein